jgi:hypothetical protein
MKNKGKTKPQQPLFLNTRRTKTNEKNKQQKQI